MRAAAALTGVSDATQPERDQPLMLRTWFEHFSGTLTAEAAAQTVREVIALLPSDGETTGEMVSIMDRAREVMQDLGRASEGLALEDAFFERRSGAVWTGTLEVLVPRGALWSYASTAPPDNKWSADTAWDDSAWHRAEAPFARHQMMSPASGFLTADGAPRPVFFRHLFTVPEGKTFTALKLRLRCCDGALILLNGTEVAAHNLNPDKTGAPKGGGKYGHVLLLPAGALRPGLNLLAVTVFPAASRSDIETLTFDPVLEARE